MKMESVFAAGARPLRPQLLRPRITPQFPITNHALKLGAHNSPFDFRFKKNALRLQMMERWQPVSALKSNPSGGDSIKDKSDGAEKGDAAKGPPFLTILAGFLVLLLVFWVIGSVLLWLISLFVTLPPPK